MRDLCWHDTPCPLALLAMDWQVLIQVHDRLKEGVEIQTVQRQKRCPRIAPETKPRSGVCKRSVYETLNCQLKMRFGPE